MQAVGLYQVLHHYLSPDQHGLIPAFPPAHPQKQCYYIFSSFQFRPPYQPFTRFSDVYGTPSTCRHYTKFWEWNSGQDRSGPCSYKAVSSEWRRGLNKQIRGEIDVTKKLGVKESRYNRENQQTGPM